MRDSSTRLPCLLLLAAAALVAGAVHGAALDVNNGAACAGSFGLEVTPGSLCLFDTENTVSGPVTGTHGACAFLFAESATTSGATTFVAGERIALGNGFAVAGEFTARISPAISSLAFVADDSPNGEVTYRASFQLNLDGLSLDTDDLIRHLVGLSREGRRWFEVRLIEAAFPPDENRLLLAAQQDDGSTVVTPFGEQLVIPPAATRSPSNGWRRRARGASSCRSTAPRSWA